MLKQKETFNFSKLYFHEHGQKGKKIKPKRDFS